MENLPENIAENVSLDAFSTFRIGGPARYLCRAQDQAQAEAALEFAVANELRVFVLGRGSNLLISDAGFDGLVLKYEDARVQVRETAQGVEVEAGGGASLTKLSLDLSKEGLGGLEWAAGIPATVGGGVSNNCGAHGSDMGTVVRSIRALEMKTAEGEHLEAYAVREMESAEAEFSYRTSLFKRTKKFLILSAILSLLRSDKETLQATIEAKMKKRAEIQPLEYPNIGSIFKNPVLSPGEMEKLCGKCPAARGKFESGTVPAGWLIEMAELKGTRIGGAMVSPKHANFIVKAGEARAEDVVMLISLIKQKVRTRFGLQLKEEIEYVGF
jgi:UDP-N-acetylmuramate dehydrogenase